jgi:hypothetical protein
MPDANEPAVLRHRLLRYVQRAQQSLADEHLNAQEAYALVRNLAAAIIADVDTMALAPQQG